MNGQREDVRRASAPLYRPLSQDGVRKIAEAAFEAPAKSGMSGYWPTALDAFGPAGAQVDTVSLTLRLPRSLVEDSAASNPSSITLRSGDGRRDAVLERGRVYFGTGAAAIFMFDLETGGGAGRPPPRTSSDTPA